MSGATPLDLAHAAMAAAPEDEAARRRFYACLAGCDLVLLLADEPADGAPLVPALFDLDGGRAVLAFDGEERLAAFAGEAVPYAALPGRALARLLHRRGLALGVNLGVAPSAILIPAEGVDWLAEGVSVPVLAGRGRPTGFRAPKPPGRAAAGVLCRALDRAAGLATAAWLVEADWPDGTRGALLVVAGVPPEFRPALALALAEALTLAGPGLAAPGSAVPDLAFLHPDEEVPGAIAEVGLELGVPAPPVPPAPPAPGPPGPPGSDPDRPPRLRRPQ